jgi:hypothetical protein
MTELDRAEQLRQAKQTERDTARAAGNCLSKFKGCEVVAMMRPDGTYKRRCASCSAIQVARTKRARQRKKGSK